MSLASDFDDVAGEAAAMRNEMFGRNEAGTQQMFMSEGMAAPLPCYFTARNGQILDPAMMLNVNEGFMRISKSVAKAAVPPFVPRLGQIIKLIGSEDGGGDLTIELGERLDSAWNLEFVASIKNVFK